MNIKLIDPTTKFVTAIENLDAIRITDHELRLEFPTMEAVINLDKNAVVIEIDDAKVAAVLGGV